MILWTIQHKEAYLKMQSYEYAIKKEKRVINTSSHLREW